MATVYSNVGRISYGATSEAEYYRVRMNYAVTSDQSETATVGVTETSVQRSRDGENFSDISSTASSQTITIGGTETVSKAITKTHSSQNIAVSGSWYFRALRLKASASVTVSAKSSYAVLYDANGGSGAPSAQTKWFGETLTISSSTPNKDGYTFKGWATSVANASAGTVNYASGASYTANAGATLYAVWELIYQKPTIQRLSVERCLQNGTLDDEGKYAKVTFDWAIYQSNLARYYGGDAYPYASNSVSDCTVTVGTKSATATLTGSSGTASVVVGAGTFDTDTSYSATVSITDSQSIYSGTTTASGTLPLAFFPMDYNADASAVGFFMPAPDDGDGAYFGKDILISIDTSASAGTVDYAIYQALSALGWDNDVLV